MQKVRRQVQLPVPRREQRKLDTLRPLVGAGFQVLFTPRQGFFSPFPHGTLCTIGQERVFSLGWWSTRIPPGFHVSRGTWVPSPGRLLTFRLRGFHPLWPPIPERSARWEFCNSPSPSALGSDWAPLPPPGNARGLWHRDGFGLLPFRSPLLGESRLLSFPPGTEMFHFPGYRLLGLCIHPRMTGVYPRRVSPFGHPGIKACLPAPPGLSQAATPFIACSCRGIHPAPLVAYPKVPLPIPIRFSKNFFLNLAVFNIQTKRGLSRGKCKFL